jgi:transposase
LLKLSLEMIERCQKTEYALVSSLQRDPVLADRIKRLRTVPGVGPITALTWALEIGDVSRFRTIKNAVSVVVENWTVQSRQGSIHERRSATES